jgi:aspartyl-tRNA synthetase
MRNRFRIEIYDANKAHDLTLYSETNVDRQHLSEIVFSNLRNFQGVVKAYVFDNRKKKKTVAIILDESVVRMANKNINRRTALELGFI